MRELAKRLADQLAPDVVVSNAAVMAEIRDVTAEGLQRTLVTNHLAPYLLLRSLVEPIGRRPARFVVVGASPNALRRVPVDLDDLGFENERGLGPVPSFRPFAAYGRTKNMNVMFVYGLARRLEGTNVTVNGAHPGIIKGTGLGQGASRGLLRVFNSVLDLYPWMPGPDAGADTPVWLAIAAEVDGIAGASSSNAGRSQPRPTPPTSHAATASGTRAHAWSASPRNCERRHVSVDLHGGAGGARFGAGLFDEVVAEDVLPKVLHRYGPITATGPFPLVRSSSRPARTMGNGWLVRRSSAMGWPLRNWPRLAAELPPAIPPPSGR